MMYVPLQTEIVECPSALGADVSGGAIGCGDGSISSTAGVWCIAFDRAADHLEEALRSAKHEVESCGFTIQRIEVEAEQEALALSAAAGR